MGLTLDIVELGTGEVTFSGEILLVDDKIVVGHLVFSVWLISG